MNYIHALQIGYELLSELDDSVAGTDGSILCIMALSRKSLYVRDKLTGGAISMSLSCPLRPFSMI